MQNTSSPDTFFFMAPAAIITLLIGAATSVKILNEKRAADAAPSPPQPPPTPKPEPGSEDQNTIKTIITEEARRQGLNPQIALLFAFLETRFTNRTGDPKWPFKRDKFGKTNWEKAVLNSKVLRYNPYAEQKELWISYGPFQILSAYHLEKVDPMADPRILADVRTNAAVGVQIIKKLQKTYNGDLKKMRLAYVCGILSATNPTGYCVADTAKLHVDLLAQAAPRYGLYVA